MLTPNPWRIAAEQKPFVRCRKHKVCRQDCKSACNTGVVLTQQQVDRLLGIRPEKATVQTQ